MKTNWVLMTAMPVTKGHEALIKFANKFSARRDELTVVVLCTQPGEPYIEERRTALSWITSHLATTQLRVIPQEIEQNPEAPGFWDMWRKILGDFGFQKGDGIIASDSYGKRLAQEMGGTFYPFDLKREIVSSKATAIRHSYIWNYDMVSDHFKPYLQKRVVIFGAESTGKTSLTRAIYQDFGPRICTPLVEWARPYLEMKSDPELEPGDMEAIFYAQYAYQHIAEEAGKPFIIQDTDLLSTVGYSQLHPEWLTEDWEEEALGYVSAADLYLFLPSSIPFEKDPLRYGGDVREGSDEFWLGVLEEYGVEYKVIESTTIKDRKVEARGHIDNLLDRVEDSIAFKRAWND